MQFHDDSPLLHAFFIKNVKNDIQKLPSLHIEQDGGQNSEMVYSRATFAFQHWNAKEACNNFPKNISFVHGEQGVQVHEYPVDKVKDNAKLFNAMNNMVL